MKEKKFLVWYRLLYVFASVSALSLLPLIWVNQLAAESKKVIIILCGAFFWGLLGMELLCLIPCSVQYEQLSRRCRLTKPYWRGKVRVGVTSFFKNREGMIADIAAIVLAVTAILLYLFKVETSWIVIPCVVLTLFSWNLRCLLNGKNRYLYLRITNSGRRNSNGTDGI